ncbi:hypothetical protein C8D88_1108 [Lentzea atacamensis]|uniref:Uncharacterized protein n=1 Tax=Lentzea atacamensis TaxID=531938 RepID=A0A316HZC8_9PSEU|nr:hypothetical protein C8D88_1108 [Lentzea atacamensis]
MLLMTGLHQVPAPLQDTVPESWRRYLDLLFGALLR